MRIMPMGISIGCLGVEINIMSSDRMALYTGWRASREVIRSFEVVVLTCVTDGEVWRGGRIQ